MTTVSGPQPPSQGRVVGFRRQHDIRSTGELAIVNGLRRIKAELPEAAGLSWATNVLVEAQDGQMFEVDVVIFYQGRAAAVEVDGPHHLRKWAFDRMRAMYLEDGGLSRVDHIDVVDTNEEQQVYEFLKRHLRLVWRAA